MSSDKVYFKDLTPEFARKCREIYVDLAKEKKGSLTKALKFVSANKFQGISGKRSFDKLIPYFDLFFDNKVLCVPHVEEESDTEEPEQKNDKKKKQTIISKSTYDKCIIVLSNVSDKFDSYYKIDIRKRNRELEKGIDRMKNERDIIVGLCCNKIPTTNSRVFFSMLETFAKKGTVVCDYICNISPMTLVCPELHHYSVTKNHIEKRIKADKNLCGNCGEDTRSNNEYLRTKVSDTETKIKMFLEKLGVEFISFDSKTRMVQTNCPCCKKQYGVEMGNIKRGWKSCRTCQNVVSGLKYTQKEIEDIFSKKGVYTIGKYENKDVPIVHKCPGCFDEISSTLRDIRERSIILCTNCRFNFSFVKVNLDKYGVDLSPKHERESAYLDCVKIFYSKREKTILDSLGLDIIQTKKWEKFFEQDIMKGNSIMNKKRNGRFTDVSSFEKSKENSQNKTYALPSGETIIVSGYEPEVLDTLINYVDEKDIITSSYDIPIIEYMYFDGKRRYFPDIFVKERNLIVEVKSLKTYCDSADKNIIKMLYSFYSGYNIELWIVSKKYYYILFITQGKNGMDLSYKILPVKKNRLSDESVSCMRLKFDSYKNIHITNTKVSSFNTISEWDDFKIVRNVITNIFRSHSVVSEMTVPTYIEPIVKILEKLRPTKSDCLVTSDEKNPKKIVEIVFDMSEDETEELEISFESSDSETEDIHITVTDELFRKSVVDLNYYFNDRTFSIPKNITQDIKKLRLSSPAVYRSTINCIMELLPQKFPTVKDCIAPEDLQKKYNIKNIQAREDTDGRLVSNTKCVGFLNFFVLDQIMNTKTGTKKKQNIHDVWKDPDEKRKLIDATFKNKSLIQFTPLSVGSKYSYLGCRGYNFPTNIAAYMYNKFGKKRVLDFCAGFGGRLLGFWNSKVEEYVGIDPNKYIDYNSLISWLKDNDSKNKKISILRKPAEDVDFSTLGKFDLVFTSPPYYDLEVYSSDKTQSSSRYHTYNEWLSKFLLHTLDKSISVLNKGGYLAINIQNINKYDIADDMCEYLDSLKTVERVDDVSYKKSTKNKTKKGEVIYMYRKL